MLLRALTFAIAIGAAPAGAQVCFDPGDADADGVGDACERLPYDPGRRAVRRRVRSAAGDSRASPTYLSGAVVADLDGDLDADVLAWRGYEAVLLENLGGGAFDAARPLWVDGYPFSFAPTLADLDGDGDLDVVTSHTDSGLGPQDLVWHENDGSGGFATEHPIDLSITGFTLGRGGTTPPADVDGDGDLDLFRGSEDGIGWYENVGGGAFAALK